jgi:isopenicillin N synthase-like dioxygenase
MRHSTCGATFGSRSCPISTTHNPALLLGACHCQTIGPARYVQLPPAERVRASPIHGRNQWPDSRPAFTSVLRAYVRDMGALGDAVMRGIAAGLDLQQDFFEKEYRGLPYWVVRVIHYPPLPQADTAERALQGAACHSPPELLLRLPLHCCCSE